MELIRIQKENIHEVDFVMDMIFEEWGKSFSSSKEDKLIKIKQGICSGEQFPQVYVLKDGTETIGSFNILAHELDGFDLSPWLACVVINKKYRGQGFGLVLLKQIERIIDQNFDEIYLTTEHIGFYEKIGFELLTIVDNNGKNNRLYYRKKK